MSIPTCDALPGFWKRVQGELARFNGNGVFITDLTYDATLGTELLSATRKTRIPIRTPVQTAITEFEHSDASNPGLVTGHTVAWKHQREP